MKACDDIHPFKESKASNCKRLQSKVFCKNTLTKVDKKTADGYIFVREVWSQTNCSTDWSVTAFQRLLMIIQRIQE